MLLRGRIVLGVRFLDVIFPRILARKGHVHEAHSLEKFLAMDPFFPQFFLFGAFGEFDGVFRSQFSRFT